MWSARLGSSSQRPLPRPPGGRALNPLLDPAPATTPRIYLLWGQRPLCLLIRGRQLVASAENATVEQWCTPWLDTYPYADKKRVSSALR
jgi:hypothetical protein